MMDFKKLLYVAIFSAFMGGSFVSCDDDDETSLESNPQPEEVNGFYLLNRGSNGENNSSIHYYDYQTKELSKDLYSQANGSSLGESAQQMLIYGSKIYVAVTFSNRISVLDKDGKLLKSIDTTEKGQPMNPRCLTAADGKVYVSYYNGHAVASLDTTTLSIEKTVSVGRYPEEIVATNGKLYVANSGGMDNPNYGKTVSVLDLETFTKEKDIDVIINPVSMQADSKGNVYVVSMGDYKDVKNTLQRIDAVTGDVKTIGNGTLIRIVNDKLYVIYAQYGEKASLAVYDALTGKLEVPDLADITKLESPTSLGVDPISHEICIADGPYNSTGTLYFFDKDGKQINSIDANGYAPMSICYAVK